VSDRGEPQTRSPRPATGSAATPTPPRWATRAALAAFPRRLPCQRLPATPRSRGAPRLRRGVAERWGVWGAISWPPISVIEQFRGYDPLQDLGNLPLGSVVTGVLELVRGRIVERARRHVGPRGRVAERLHAPLGVLAAQHEVHEHLRGVRVGRAFDDREEW